MKKLFVLFFAVLMQFSCYGGNILVYKTTTTTTVFDIVGDTMTKETEKGHLVLDVNLATQTILDARQIIDEDWGAEVKIADVVFHSMKSPACIVTEYLCGDKDAILSGNIKQTDIGFGRKNKKPVAITLKGSVFVFNDVLGSGDMIATLDTKQTKAANKAGDDIDTVIGRLGGGIPNCFGECDDGDTDTTPPEPNVMTFAVDPNAISDTEITMTATTATDADTPPVEYYFTNVTDPNHNSGWQSSPTFVDTGLIPETTYTYNVKARDSAAPVPNQTAASADANATTQQTPDSNAPTPVPMTWAIEPYASGSSSIITQTTIATDSSGRVKYQFWRTTGITTIARDWNADANYAATGQKKKYRHIFAT